MKRVFPPFIAVVSYAILSFGCRESDPSASKTAHHDDRALHNDKMMSLEERDLLIKRLEIRQAEYAAKSREYERLRSLSPIENALEPAGWRNVTRAFVLRLPDVGEATVVESLTGRLPSDAPEYASKRNPGLYLVGSLSPLGGFTIDSHDEERFCLQFNPDGTFIEGQGLTSGLQLKEVKGRLAQQESNPKQSDPWSQFAPPTDP